MVKRTDVGQFLACIEALAAVAASLWWHLSRVQDESTAGLYLSLQNQQDLRRKTKRWTEPFQLQFSERIFAGGWNVQHSAPLRLVTCGGNQMEVISGRDRKKRKSNDLW
jgi:hypothetical protein